MHHSYLSLFAHMAWADREVLTALRSGTTADPRWVELFGHILGAEHVWLSRLEERPPAVAVWPALTLEECAALADANQKAFANLVERMKPGDDRRMIRYRNSAGQEFESSIQDILLQVSLHGSYHRGQIAMAMREAGAVPAPTDYIGFIRGTPAATRQRER